MIVRYVGSLKYSIQDKISLCTIFELADAINMAERIERTHATHLGLLQLPQPLMCMKIPVLTHFPPLKEKDHFWRPHQGNKRFT